MASDISPRAVAHAEPLVDLCQRVDDPDALRAALRERWPLSLREYLRRDREANTPGGWKRRLSVLAFRLKWYPVHYGKGKVWRVLGKLFSLAMTYVLIHEVPVPGVFIGPGLKLPHGWSNIYLHHNAIIGENVTLFQDVMIGENAGPPALGTLVVGDGAVLGRGASVFGACRVGDASIVGAHALLVNMSTGPGEVWGSPLATRIR